MKRPSGNRRIAALFVICALLALNGWSPAARAQSITAASPDQSLVASIRNSNGNLTLSLSSASQTVVEPGQLGISIDNRLYGKNMALRRILWLREPSRRILDEITG